MNESTTASSLAKITRKQLVKYCINLHDAKNKDYGNSFDKTCEKFSAVVICIRLNDKISRIQSILKSGKANVSNESLFDTWLDMFNYAVMSEAWLQYKYGNATDTMTLFNMYATRHLTKQAELKLEGIDNHSIDYCMLINDNIFELLRQPAEFWHNAIDLLVKLQVIAFEHCLQYDLGMLQTDYI